MSSTITKSNPFAHINFSRVSTGTFVGSNGLIQTAAVNAPRLEYDSASLTLKGLLVEPGSTNIVPSSVNFTTGQQSWVNQNASTLQISTIAPDGSNTAFQVSNTINLSSFIRNNTNTSNGTYTLSFWAQYVSGNGLIFLEAFQVSASDYFNIQNGTVVNSVGKSLYTIQAYPNGWYRCTATKQFTSGSPCTGAVYLGAYGLYTGNVTFNLWGFQVEQGTVATSYIPTTNLAVTRAPDVVNTNTTAFKGYYNQTQGTVVYKAIPKNTYINQVIGSFNDNTSLNFIRGLIKNSGTISDIRTARPSLDGTVNMFALANITATTVGQSVMTSTNDILFTENTSNLYYNMYGAATSANSNFLVGGASGYTYNTTNNGSTFSYVGTELTHSSVYYGINQYIVADAAATNIGGVLTSLDGITWTRRNIPSITASLLASTSNGTNQFISVGQNGTIVSSPDGVTWTAQTSGITQNINWVTYGNGLYIAGITNATQPILTSSDGITWTKRTCSGASVCFGVVYNGSNLYVAVFSTGQIFTSPDGVTWTVKTSGTSNDLKAIIYANSQYVAVGNAGTILTSPDATTWTVRTSNTANSLSAITYNGSVYAATGVLGTIVTSPDGITWTVQTSISSTQAFYGITYANSQFVIVGSAGYIITSPDLVTLTSRNGVGTQLNAIAYGNGVYVVAGSGASLNTGTSSALLATYNSSLGYTRRTSNTTQNLLGIRYLNSKFIAVGNNSALCTSTDGITWSNITISGTNANYYDVAYNGANLYVAVGYGASSGRYTTSTDGVTWTSAAALSAVNASPRAMMYFGGTYVVVGDAGTIFTSTNGTTWTQQTSGTTQNLYAVLYSTISSVWYAYGANGTILTSPNATSWSNVTNAASTSVLVGGTVKANTNTATGWVNGSLNKIAISYQANNLLTSINGGPAVANTTTTIPTNTQFSIGMNGTQSQQFNGWIQRIDYYPTVSSSATLIGLST